MNKSAFSLIKILIVLFLVFAGVSAQAYESNVVVGFKVEGNRLIEEKIILLNLTMKVGDTLAPQAVQEEIARIGEMGFSLTSALKSARPKRAKKLFSRLKKMPLSARSTSKA